MVCCREKEGHYTGDCFRLRGLLRAVSPEILDVEVIAKGLRRVFTLDSKQHQQLASTAHGDVWHFHLADSGVPQKHWTCDSGWTSECDCDDEYHDSTTHCLAMHSAANVACAVDQFTSDADDFINTIH